MYQMLSWSKTLASRHSAVYFKILISFKRKITNNPCVVYIGQMREHYEALSQFDQFLSSIMSDPLNANPTIIDVSDLPTRLSGAKTKDPKDELLNLVSTLSLRPKATKHELGISVPDLVSDAESEATQDELEEEDENEEEDVIDAQEIFDLISTISDPEHPLTLAQLAVVNLPDIEVTHGPNKEKDISEVLIKITPTITHCSLATLIGLGIRVRLERSLPPRFRIRILIKEGTHQSENQVNKQLNDKERVAAACENDQLLNVILQMLSTCK